LADSEKTEAQKCEFINGLNFQALRFLKTFSFHAITFLVISKNGIKDSHTKRRKKKMFKQSPHHPDIFSLIDKQPGGCWLWKGHIDNYRHNRGYGRYGGPGQRRQAHRLIYELLRGPVPKHLDLDHLCRIRHCVNPDHLEIVTRRTNLLRGKGLAAVNARKTQCPKGHLYDAKNSSGRFCSTCQRERNKLWMRAYNPKEKSNGNEAAA
jgi:hypothetical protein